MKYLKRLGPKELVSLSLISGLGGLVVVALRYMGGL